MKSAEGVHPAHGVELHMGYKRERHFSDRSSDSGNNSEHSLYTTLVVTPVFDL